MIRNKNSSFAEQGNIILVAMFVYALSIGQLSAQHADLEESLSSTQGNTQGSAQTITKLPAAVDALIKKSSVKRDAMSLWVAPTDTGVPIVDFQSTIARNPASAEKAVTTGVGLLLLGEDYRWKTEFYTDGKVVDKVLRGNLYIKGYGNPYMVEERLMDMVVALRNVPIDVIEGDVILDNSYFENRVEDPDAFDGHGTALYNAIPNALAINFRAVDLIVENQDGAIALSTDPPLHYTQLDNAMQFNSHAACKGREGFAPIVTVDRAQDLVSVSGTLSRHCQREQLRLVLTDAGDQYFGLFKQAWELTGGQLSGDWYYGQVGADFTRLHQGLSRPLREQIQPMNKLSNNIMTRQLFLTLGAELTQPPGTLEKARAVVKNQLQRMGIDTAGLYMDNGSGLSRDSRISARQMGEFLVGIAQTNVAPVFFESLSIVGVDGTLRRRLKNTPIANNAIGKSGTLRDARAVVGYLTAKTGRQYAYVMLFSGASSPQSRPLMDGMMQWLYEQ
ncbi:D-alanyl-D-alanine carboxypeptidase/D-alanyl-D-alanine endopeptidase [Ostreibacterium oceani]|uniref:D-alanyl-D-alanine carboxypeptidase/D-alanyl-D-alanine-endopeptidase n=1 Tax=Ostreibacterium oceani TaxID=2654998 RepID=A0A6N7ESW7_9GAMM|nr:D-alanyl-D-alanine carboxypeptidase/D-alanyl-D-alanine-endopeptidase [Ostreibacterium oceani]MPV85934.1 D-alanyl-D-alanine carboxypeptidase/D-alanyl-D-alanine-endopeptidase [Ostreibacterium oceani]